VNKAGRIAIVAGLALAVAGVMWLKERERSGAGTTPGHAALPRLVEVGSDTCIPCQMMAPILAELKQEYQGQLEVASADVFKDPEAKTKYGVRLIPTQVFFDAGGRELFRHQGFISKEDILAKWRELGVDLKEPVRSRPKRSGAAEALHEKNN